MYEPGDLSALFTVKPTMKNQHTNNELSLVFEARNGDREAVQQLLLQNWHWLKGLVLGILHHWGDVDDVLQEICVRVIDKIETLRDPTRFRAWLASVARREAIKWSQKHAKQARAGNGQCHHRHDPVGCQILSIEARY